MAATGGRGDKETAIRASEARREAQSLRDERDNAQEFKIRSIESQLKILKSRSKQPNSEVSHPAKQRDELASNAESGSGEDFRSSVLKSAKMRNRLAIASHFKQEDEFKESLSLSQKKKFDAEVKKVYENFLADSGVDRELLQEWQEDAFRQSAEATVILEWRIGNYSVQKVASKPVSKEQKQAKLEKLRLLENQLADEKESEDE